MRSKSSAIIVNNVIGGAFLDVASSCLERDFDSLSGMNIITTAIILAKYGRLERQLTSKIFSVEFMDKLDMEIEEECKLITESELMSRVSYYPILLKREIMKLNRIVCINYPEYNVPWFHEKYCQ